jgi:DNA-cytosine methyltransferase
MTYSPYNMAAVRRAADRRRFSCVSFFAGGGGSSTGYRLAGGFIPLASEFVPEAANTYVRNYPETTVDQRDVRELARDQSLLGALLASNGLTSPVDIFDGSPPCNSHSVARQAPYEPYVKKRYSDVAQANTATLPFAFAEIVAMAHPRVVVMENVPGMASPSSRPILDQFIAELRDTGYFVHFDILAASDFGVPQRRRRLFVIGVLEGIGRKVGMACDSDVADAFPSPLSDGPATIRDALLGLAQRPDQVRPWTQSVMASARLWRALGMLPKCPPRLTRLSHVSSEETTMFRLTRCSYDLPAPTMTVTGQRPDGTEGNLHPEFDRKFTLPELMRLTSLPDDFILTGTLAQACERVCRMVPPLLTKAIADRIYDRILSKL